MHGPRLAAQRLLAWGLALSWAVLNGVGPGIAAAHLVGDPALAEGAGVLWRYALASGLLLAFGVGLRLRQSTDKLVALQRLNRRCLPLALLPAIGLLGDTPLAMSRGGLVVAVAVGLGLSAVYAGLHARSPKDARAPRRAPKLERWAVLGAALVVGAYLARLALVRHAAMQTNTYDFGLFVNAIWNTAQGRWFVCTLVPTGSILDEHVSPALLGFAALLRLGLPAEGLLVLQALALALGAVPAYAIGRRHLGAAGGRTFAVAYLVHPALHANALWDFHPLSFAAPLLLGILHLGSSARLRSGFVACVVALLALREEMAFVLLAYAACVALQGRMRRALVLAAAAVGTVAVINLAMGQTSSHISRYAEVSSHGGGGLWGVIVAVVLDPAFVLGHALTYGKVVYLGIQSAGVLGLALVSRRRWPLLGFAAAFSLLATSAHVFNPYFHYTTMVYPVVLGLAPAGVTFAVSRWRGDASIRTATAAWLRGVVVASLATSWAYGGLHDNASFRAGFSTPRRVVSQASRERLAWLQTQLAALPRDVGVAVTGRVGPHAAQRPLVFAYSGQEQPGADARGRKPNPNSKRWLEGQTDARVEYIVVFRSDLRAEQKKSLRRAVTEGRWRLWASRGSMEIFARIH